MIMKGLTTIIQCLYKQIYAEYDKIDFQTIHNPTNAYRKTI